MDSDWAVFLILFTLGVIICLFVIGYYMLRRETRETVKAITRDLELEERRERRKWERENRRRELDEQKVKLKCVICLEDRDKPVLFLPCRHAVVCKECANSVEMMSPCPVCREQVWEKIEVFI